MNKIIREHYPVSRLPEDLRHTFPKDATVRIIVESEERAPRKSFAQIRKEIDNAKQAGAYSSTSAAEARNQIRALRDEWDT